MRYLILSVFLFLSTTVFSQFLLIDTIAAYTDSEGIVHAETRKLEFNVQGGIEYFTDWNRDFRLSDQKYPYEIKYNDLKAANAGIRFNLWKQKLWLEGRSKLYLDQSFKPIHADFNFYLDYNLIEKLYLRLESNVDQNIQAEQYRSGRNSLVGLYYNYIVNNGIEYKMPDPVSIDFYAGVCYLLHHKYMVGDSERYFIIDWPDAVQTLIGLRINVFKNIVYYEQNLKMYTEINGWIGFTPFYSDYTSIVDIRIKDVFLRLSHTCHHPVAGNTKIVVDAIAGENTSFGIVYNLIR